MTAYETILSVIQPVLLANGFIEIERELDPEALDSRYITFNDGKERIRLTWDGKRQYFVLESIPESSTSFEFGWADILLQFYKPNHDAPEVAAEIAADMRKALIGYLQFKATTE